MWLRYRAVGYLVSVCEVLSKVDNECYLLPIVQQFLCQRVSQISTTILLCVLKEPIPRGVFDYLIKQLNIIEIFNWYIFNLPLCDVTVPYLVLLRGKLLVSCALLMKNQDIFQLLET